MSPEPSGKGLLRDAEQGLVPASGTGLPCLPAPAGTLPRPGQRARRPTSPRSSTRKDHERPGEASVVHILWTMLWTNDKDGEAVRLVAGAEGLWKACAEAVRAQVSDATWQSTFEAV